MPMTKIRFEGLPVPLVSKVEHQGPAFLTLTVNNVSVCNPNYPIVLMPGQSLIITCEEEAGT